MAEKIKIAELDIDVDAVLKSSSDYLKQINALKSAQKDLRAQGKQSSAQFVENDAKLRNLNKSYRDSQKFAASLLAVNKDLDFIMKSEGKSVNELRDSRRQLQEISKQLTGDSREEIQLRSQLNDAIDEQTHERRNQSSDFIASKDGIGEYEQAINKAVPANTLLGRVIGGVKDVLNVVTPIYKAYSGEIRSSVSGILNAAKGTEGLTKAQKAQVVATNLVTNSLKLFKVALISTGIGAILVALGSLIAFLSSTQKGVDKVNSVLKPMQVIFDRLLGVLQQVGEKLFNAFSDPQKLISDLGKLIKENLLNRFAALQRIIEKVVSFDFEGLGDDMVEAATGVKDLGEKTSKFFEDAKGFLEESIDLGRQLYELQIQIEELENGLVVTNAALNAEYEKSKEIAQDVSKSFEERNDAARRAIAQQDALLLGQQQLLDKKIEEKEIQNSLNDTSRQDQKELNELYAQRIALEGQAARKRASARNLLKTINNEAIAQTKAQMNASIELANTELEIFQERNKELLSKNNELNEAIISARVQAEEQIKDAQLEIIQQKLDTGLINEKQAELERLKINNSFNERIASVNDAFRKQEQEKKDKELEKNLERKKLEAEAEQELKILQAETDTERELLELEQKRQREVEAAEKIGADTTAINEKYAILQTQIEEKQANARKKIEQQVQNSKLSSLASALGQAAGLLNEQTGVAKALGIAQATIDTYIGANKALATLPPPFGAIQAGITIASGLSNVTKIAGVKFAKGGILQGPSHAQGGIKTPYGEIEGQEIILTKGVTKNPYLRSLASYINEAGGGRKFESGGILGSSINPSVKNMPPIIDYDLLSAKIAQANMSLPIPVLPVDEFNKVNNKVVNIRSGANV